MSNLDLSQIEGLEAKASRQNVSLVALPRLESNLKLSFVSMPNPFQECYMLLDSEHEIRSSHMQSPKVNLAPRRICKQPSRNKRRHNENRTRRVVYQQTGKC